MVLVQPTLENNIVNENERLPSKTKAKLTLFLVHVYIYLKRKSLVQSKKDLQMTEFKQNLLSEQEHHTLFWVLPVGNMHMLFIQSARLCQGHERHHEDIMKDAKKESLWETTGKF